MVLDGLSLYISTKELQKTILNAKVTKILSPTRDEIVLVLHSASQGNIRLNLNAGADSCAVFAGDMGKKNPPAPGMFCMLLRKHLTAARICQITTDGLDRVVRITFEGKDELLSAVSFTLVCEIMGKYSNIILLNGTGRVMDSLKRVSVDVSSLRQILPGSVYTPPPNEQYSPLALSEQSLDELLDTRSQDRISAYVSRVFQGMSQKTAQEILLRCDMEDASISTLSSTRRRILAKNIRAFFSDAVNAPAPGCQLNGEGLPVFVSAVPYQSYPADLRRSFATMNEALYFYYSARAEHFALKQQKDALNRRLSKILTRLNKKIKTLTDGLEDAKKIDSLIKKGDLITANIYQLKRGQTSFEAMDYQTGKTVRITLDATLTPAQNAQKIYKRAAKLKTTKEIYEARLAQAEDERDFLRSEQVFIEHACSAQELDEIILLLEKEKIFEAPRKRTKTADLHSDPLQFTAPGGYTVYVGRNDKQNDRLTMGIAKKEDLWFHAKNMPGSHVLLVTGGVTLDEIDDDAVVFAAKKAAQYSAAKAGGKTAVDYTYRANVKKPPASRPGKVIYDHYYTVFVD